jgi:hypothetical protein
MIHSNLIDSKKSLIYFMSLLRLNISTQIFKDVIKYDCYQFMEDATWWNPSETIERIS